MTLTGRVEIILYVTDQQAATAFYSAVLSAAPSLEAPGMTEFTLGPDLTLGLMPEAGIGSLISPPLPHPRGGHGIPRCELYLHVDDVATAHRHALLHGALDISPPSSRDWGDDVAYVADPDGHVIAFAARTRAAGPN